MAASKSPDSRSRNSDLIPQLFFVVLLAVFAFLLFVSKVRSDEEPKGGKGPEPKKAPVRSKREDFPDAGNRDIEPAANPVRSPKFPYDPPKEPEIPPPQKLPPPAVAAVGPVNDPAPDGRQIRLAPENQVRIVNNLLTELAAKQVKGIENLRFLSYYAVPEKFVGTYVSLTNFKINQLTRSQVPRRLIEVPGSDSRLWMFDITWYGWSVEAAAEVFSREPFFREPLILGETAARSRLLLGLADFALPEGAKADQNNHVFSVVRGDWFLAETGETLRSTAYYDLLFSKERFVPLETPKKLTVRVPHVFPGGKYKGKDETEEKDYDPASFVIVNEFSATVKIKKVDFPKDETEWNKAFGVDKLDDFSKEQGVFLENGAVVEGMEVNGSIVARQNRLLARKPTAFGYHWKTFDTDKTLAKGNYFQTLNKNFDFKAGEVIAKLPNGGQAYGLFNKAGARQEEVPPDLAWDRTDPYDIRVRNPGSCIVCHARGIITPDCVVNRYLKAGGELKTRSDLKQEEAEAFFLRMGNRIELDQNSYAAFVQETAGTDPVFNAKNYAASRNIYKSGVTLDQAALELGMGKLELQMLAAKSVQARTTALYLDQFPVPRTTFDEEVFPELVLLASVFRVTSTNTKAKTLEELIDDTVKKYGLLKDQLRTEQSDAEPPPVAPGTPPAPPGGPATITPTQPGKMP